MMRALVVYESMYGNTRQVAEAVAHGLGRSVLARAVSVAEVAAADVAGCGLLVVGGPTHVHGMSRASTRHSAATVAEATGSRSIEPHADAGIRDWLAQLRPDVPGQKAAAFDTRAQGPALLTGRASKGIAVQLREAGFELVSEPESFKVTSAPELGPDEIERARLWGESLAAKIAPAI
ncbi:flavodoxin domain-containing protein [Arthrobacter sp. MI7-26]|uniref:flavodoxin family protein n=1 Tax=Arthrobacter sp. MI7-26 TaxID=2993653 RepID=UPI00224907B3|nr:flavodoxin domain-containing protein [Arthrobacter sp. MI7-26]MCX2749625.1 flavodoxin domain-containing protein [Arthrobacter sp. MI7-26]